MSVPTNKYDTFSNFISECKKYVNKIETYSGSDVLAPWYTYLLWMEENFQMDFYSETIFDTLLAACLCQFESDERYSQDRRLIKLFIKFIHFQVDPNMHYKQMLSHGCGTKVADFYVSWAFHFDMKGDFEKAEEIFERGFSARAEPIELLKSAHEAFGFSMSQRLLYKSDDQFQREYQVRMQKQLQQMVALRITGRNEIDNKSSTLLRIDSSKLTNVCIPHAINSFDLSPDRSHNTSIAQSIMDSARKMRRERRSTIKVSARLDFNENTTSEGATVRRKGKPPKYTFEDGIQLYKNFVPEILPHKSHPIRAYRDPDMHTHTTPLLPAYDKIMLIPGENIAFSPEELRAYNWFQQKKIVNAFTKEYDQIWGVGYEVPMRWSDWFAAVNLPQPKWSVPRISPNEELNEDGPHKFKSNMTEMYPKHSTEEFQLEEIMWMKRTADINGMEPLENKSVTKLSKIHSRTCSIETDLSPIIEMELSACGDFLVEVPPKRESMNPRNLIEANKKRKSSIFPTFDALNDTCTTQMFSNLLHRTVVSKPKVSKMAKYEQGESSVQSTQDDTKLKLFTDQSDPLFEKEAKENVQPSQKNDFMFAIFEDTTVAPRNFDIERKRISESSMGNKENVVMHEKPILEQSNILCAQKVDKVVNGSTVINSSVRIDEPTMKDVKSRPFEFDIYKDNTKTDVSLNPRTNTSIGIEAAKVNEMINTLLNATKSVPADESVFKEPTLVNIPTRKTESKKPDQTCLFDLLDTTEEFEAIEAQCADSPTGMTPIKKADGSFARIATPSQMLANRNKTKAGIEYSIFITEKEQQNIIDNSRFNDKTYLDTTRRRTLLRQSVVENEDIVEIEDDENVAGNDNAPSEKEDVALLEKDNDNIDNIEDVDRDHSNEDIGKTIYVKQEDPEFKEEDAVWQEVTQFLAEPPVDNDYKIEEVDLDETRQRIDTHMLNLKDLNPFDPEVQNDVLTDLGFVELLNGANNFNCHMMNFVQPLKPRSSFEIDKKKYKILKLIGTGAYGKVFSTECTKTKEMFAFKQQRPPNLWEYYVCLQVHQRIEDEKIRKGFMSVDFAVIGNNSTIYASQFSKYGTLLNVCNKVKQATNKNIEECIVMILVKQMFTIIEHFHNAKFIHADIKPDNFLLMNKLCLNYENPDLALQLIDFEQSIDLSYFSNHVFWAKVRTENFVCTEMMESRPWTFHCDLFCLASTIYTMVAGKYMVVSRRKSSDQYKTQKLPRYVNATLWNEIFDTLINIPSLKKMPSLSRLQDLLDVELKAIGSKKVTDAIHKFNNALD